MDICYSNDRHTLVKTYISVGKWELEVLKSTMSSVHYTGKTCARMEGERFSESAVGIASQMTNPLSSALRSK